ncbi:MAG: TonB-dependent receptor [Bryobacterales bacterium]|nr:TonB-dependent receptor [Bryobacterales bacterium]
MSLAAQSLGNAGTIEGTVADPSGAFVANASIHIENAVSGYRQTVKSQADGTFRLVNIPPNQYHLQAEAPGFAVHTEDLSIRRSLPVQVKISLDVAGSKTVVTVEGAGADVLETNPSAHVDVDRSIFSKLPSSDPAGGLSQAIANSTGGVAADGNGFFHPLGDHAQVSFVVDGQPISDQQSKVFSTQLPTSAIQSMELITGNPSPEFGDKTSLVVEVTTRSGLGAGRVFGNLDANYGSFGTVGGSAGLGFGNARLGNFLAVDGVRSGRFLDTPEFAAIHDKGNNQTLFDRLDYLPNGKDAFHLNLFSARNWIQIPNSYDQLTQDQRQRVLTWSVAPGYQHTINANALLTINPYIRKDQFTYYGSRDPFDDTPATQSQSRQLLNWGVKADMVVVKGRHQVKFGVDAKQTRLREVFGFGITDSTFNDPCLDADGAPSGDTTIKNPSQCAAAGFDPNTDENPNVAQAFLPGLAPFDLTRGGSLFSFRASRSINQVAFYGVDTYTAGNLVLTLGIRVDSYRGLPGVSTVEPQPRAGLAYRFKTGTVLRAAYARTMETPFNENLLLSSATGVGGLAENVFGSSSVPIRPGFRNQFNAGFQQAVGRFLLIDGDYFWKYTHNAYDFGTLLNTTITFPISWHNSKVDGFSGRITTTNLHGFVAFWTFGHNRARYFPPENGGLIPPGNSGGGPFLIDHDQKFQSTLSARYQRPKNAEWIAFTYRYDSGLVVSGISDSDAALDLTPNQQVSIGLACGNSFATVANPITTCSGTITSKLLNLPSPADASEDHDPSRVKPRHILNLGVGTDNLMHREGHRRITAALEISNLTDKVAVYNFLSTFSGTHFLQPRAVTARIGYTF